MVGGALLWSKCWTLLDQVDEGVAIETKANHFAMHGLLLRGEGEHHEGGSSKIIIFGSWGKDATIPNLKGDALEAKRGIIGSRCRVFARLVQEEERNTEHVDDCKGLGCAMIVLD
jgi:hypothetical protein